MAMLADRKRRQKWSLNPRGNEWSKNSNKFGQKLMERMGWKEGKGLGAKEDGATDHVRVAYKNDSKGIGFKESVEWSLQQDNFGALLDELNNTSTVDNSPVKVTSLEEMSEKSRARVHYRKFTRGKDLSRYSEKDLANILGRKKLQKENKSTTIELEKTTTIAPQFGVNTTTGGSMIEYFKNKLPNFMVAENKTIDNNSESETNYGFGFNALQAHDVKEKKKRKNDLTNPDEVPIKKHKANKEIIGIGIVNQAFDPLSRNIITNNQRILETISENDEQCTMESNDNTTEINKKGNIFLLYKNNDHYEQDKKLKKKKSCVENTNYRQEAVENNPYEVTVKTKMKKHKCSKDAKYDTNVEDEVNKNAYVGFDNPSFNINSLEIHDVIRNRISNETENKKQKALKTCAVSTSINYDFHMEKVKTKKKKHKSYADGCSFPTQLDVHSNNTLTVDTHSYVKQKKKKQRNVEYFEYLETLNESHLEIEGTQVNSINSSTNITDISNISASIKTKSKKKSKKDTKEGVENPCFNVIDMESNQSHETEAQNANDNEFEVKIKSKRKKPKTGIDNLGFAINLVSIETSLSKNEFEAEQKIKRRNKAAISCESVKSIETTGEFASNKTKTKRKKDKSISHAAESIPVEVAIPTSNKQKGPNDVFSANKLSKMVLHGVDNPAINLNDSVDDGDIILNVTDEPIPTKTSETKRNNKNVRFSNVNTEYIFQSEHDGVDGIAARKKLFDINSKMMESDTRNKLQGLDNACFNLHSNVMEESVNSLTKSLENCQAEVENGINESKINKNIYEERMVGQLSTPDAKDEANANGVILRYKNSHFSPSSPYWLQSNNASVSYPKKSYKHLIQGDIVVCFKDSNLHKIYGYGKPNKS